MQSIVEDRVGTMHAHPHTMLRAMICCCLSPRLATLVTSTIDMLLHCVVHLL
jgi:hypothetical protein